MVIVPDHTKAVASISSVELSVIRLSTTLIHVGIYPQKFVTQEYASQIQYYF